MVNHGEVLFEFVRVGRFVKVTALDTKSLIEISIVGTPQMTQQMMKTAALTKLRYVIAKRAAEKP